MQDAEERKLEGEGGRSEGEPPKTTEQPNLLRTYYVQSSEKLPICTDSFIALTFESNTMVCAADPTLAPQPRRI